MKRCPNCGATTFVVTAHVTQDWKVDGDGDFLDVVNDCIDVTHRPDNSDWWECFECGFGGEGKEFEVK